MTSSPFRIGVISDTHGLLRREAVTAMEGSDLILHAGDVGGGEILEELRRVAPVHAVRGNTDHGKLGRSLPLTEVVEAGTAILYVVHILADLDLDPSAAGIHAVIFGHTHRPEVSRRDGVLYLNPGSAGPHPSGSSPTVARLEVTPDHEGPRLEAEFLELESG